MSAASIRRNVGLPLVTLLCDTSALLFHRRVASVKGIVFSIHVFSSTTLRLSVEVCKKQALQLLSPNHEIELKGEMKHRAKLQPSHDPSQILLFSACRRHRQSIFAHPVDACI